MTNQNREKSNFRIGVIGFGKMGMLHGAILNLLMPRSLSSIVDVHRLTSYGASRLIKGTRLYRKVDDMIEREKLTAVYVTTPVSSHLNIVSELFDSDIEGVFIEKPPTVNSAELASLVLRKKNAQLVMVGLQKRFALPFEHARVLLSNGVIGKISHVESYIRSGNITAPTDRFDSIARGCLLDLGVHLIDLLVLNFRVSRVDACYCDRLYTSVDDLVTAQLRTEDSIGMRVEVSWSIPTQRLPETCIKVYGFEGQLEVTEDYLKVKSSKPHKMLNDKSELELYKPEYYQSTPSVNISDPEYGLEDMHFLSCLRSHTEPITNLVSVTRTMEIIDEMYRVAGLTNGN
jgi:predicted dehydrogenase